MRQIAENRTNENQSKAKIWECKIINNFVLKSMERFANKLTEMKHKKGAWPIASAREGGFGGGGVAAASANRKRTEWKSEPTTRTSTQKPSNFISVKIFVAKVRNWIHVDTFCLWCNFSFDFIIFHFLCATYLLTYPPTLDISFLFSCKYIMSS